MNRFVLKNTFIKVYVYHFSINIFFKKNKRSKLCFGDRVAVLNDFLYQYGGSITLDESMCIRFVLFLLEIIHEYIILP